MNLISGATPSAFGQCLVNETDKICLITIPKCGSVSLKSSLEKTKMFTATTVNNISNLNDPGWIFICVIRNPLERWISGFVQYVYILFCSGEGNKKECRNVLYKKTQQIFEQFTFDAHTETQVSYLNYFKEYIDKPIIFFKLDKINELYKWFSDHGYNIEKTKKNISNDIPLKKEINSILKTFINNNSIYKDKINEYHKDDWCLYKELNIN